MDDDAIRGAQRTLWQAARIAAEPAAAVGIVALLTGAYKAAQREAAPAWNATKSRRQAETPPGSTASR